MTVRAYLDLVRTSHEAKGGISGQRETLRTTTGKRIRDRMVSDIRRGAVLPPVVIGAVVDAKTFSNYPATNAEDIRSILPVNALDDLAIIDGMQRTAALIEAADLDVNVLSNPVRVEFWITRDVRSMVYRMLVLNTGQVPWTLSRQLAVVFGPLLNELKRSVPELGRVFSPDQPGRRVAPTEYSSDSLVEMYLSFSLRKVTLDTKEALSDEFSRLDFVDNLATRDFQDQFYDMIGLMARLDKVFSKYNSGSGRFSKGRSIFDTQPARIGFAAAVGQYVLGRPGMDRSPEERTARLNEIKLNAGRLIERLDQATESEVGDFLRLDILTDTLDKRVGQVGRFERLAFFDAFLVLIQEKFALTNMEPCWRVN